MKPTMTENNDFYEYLRVVMKRRWTIITVLSILFFTTAIYSFTATPMYNAVTRLVIDKTNPNIVSIQEVMAVDASETYDYQTQYKIIESRAVAKEVIRRLDLEHSEEFVSQGGLLSRGGRAFGRLMTAEDDLLKNAGKAAEDDAGGKIDPRLVTALIKRIEVKPVRNSRLLDINFQASSPVLAARVADTIAQAYIDYNLETKLQAAQAAVQWLQGRIESERRKVEETEQALLNYKKEQDIITDFSNDVEQITAQKLAKLNNQVVEAESERVEVETRYRQAAALAGSSDMIDAIPEVLNNDLIKQIKSMEVELFQKESELSKKYGQNHPKMVALRSERASLRKRKAYEVDKVINSLKNEYQVALAREQSLRDALTKQKQETLTLNQKAIEYGVLRRQTESARQMYELLVNRFKETSLTEEMKTGNIRIIDPAEVPRKPVSPKKGLNLLLALLVGLVAGVSLAFFYEYLDNTIKDPDDIKHYLNAPYLGAVPAVDMVEAANAGKNKELVTSHAAMSAASEAYRDIRTSILFSSVEAEPRTLLVTSAGPQEGKTMTAGNLAITLAQSGSSVVLVDCDLRRPRVNAIFGEEGPSLGVTNVLVENRDVGEIIVSSDIENLSLLASGPVPPNPSELLGSERMAGLIQSLQERFDRIVIDSPPVFAVTDAVVLSKSVDGVVLVVRANDKPGKMVADCLEKISSVGGNVLGVILNHVTMNEDSAYSYHYSGYGYYYGENEEST